VVVRWGVVEVRETGKRVVAKLEVYRQKLGWKLLHSCAVQLAKKKAVDGRLKAGTKPLTCDPSALNAGQQGCRTRAGVAHYSRTSPLGRKKRKKEKKEKNRVLKPAKLIVCICHYY
jgi:hypothetical protein